MNIFKKSPMHYLMEDNWYRDFDYIIKALESCQNTPKYDRAMCQLINTYAWGKRVLDAKVSRAAARSDKSHWSVRGEVDLFYQQLRVKRGIIEEKLLMAATDDE